jgi:hypothetical protein
MHTNSGATAASIIIDWLIALLRWLLRQWEWMRPWIDCSWVDSAGRWR